MPLYILRTMPPKIKPSKTIEARINEEFKVPVRMVFYASLEHTAENHTEDMKHPKIPHFDYVDIYFNNKLVKEGEPKYFGRKKTDAQTQVERITYVYKIDYETELKCKLASKHNKLFETTFKCDIEPHEFETIYYYKGNEIDRLKTKFVLPEFSAKKDEANERFLKFMENRYQTKVDCKKDKLKEAVKKYGPQ